MTRRAAIDKNGLLIGHGFFDEHQGEALIPVPDDFSLEPRQWYYGNGAWHRTIKFVPPTKSWWQFWRK